MEAGSTLWVARIFGAAVGWGRGSGPGQQGFICDASCRWGGHSLAVTERPGCRAVGMLIPGPRLPPGTRLRGTQDPHGEGPVGRPKA